MAPYFRFNIPCAITTTTTTTTTTAPPCYCYLILAENGTTTISYSRCNDGVTINLEVLSGETAYVCSRNTPVYVSGAAPSINACTGIVNCTSNVNCIDCNGATTTTTSTTTTTTTAAPTTTSTTTTTTTAAPTTTSTTTTTTTILEYAVGVYGKLTSAVETPIKFQYSSDSGANWIDAGDYFDSTTCALRGSFNVPSGTSVLLRATDGANTYYHARANNSTTCPGAPYGACESLSGNITANRDVAITVDMFTVCDITTTTTTTTLPPEQN